VVVSPPLAFCFDAQALGPYGYMVPTVRDLFCLCLAVVLSLALSSRFFSLRLCLPVVYLCVCLAVLLSLSLSLSLSVSLFLSLFCFSHTLSLSLCPPSSLSHSSSSLLRSQWIPDARGVTPEWARKWIDRLGSRSISPFFSFLPPTHPFLSLPVSVFAPPLISFASLSSPQPPTQWIPDARAVTPEWARKWIDRLETEGGTLVWAPLRGGVEHQVRMDHLGMYAKPSHSGLTKIGHGPRCSHACSAGHTVIGHNPFGRCRCEAGSSIRSGASVECVWTIPKRRESCGSWMTRCDTQSPARR
jgi:hypothetical protein